MASIYPKDNVLYVSYYIDGKKIAHSLRNPLTNELLRPNKRDKVLAEQLAQEIEMKKNKRPLKTWNLGVSLAVDKFLASKERENISSKSITMYKTVLNKIKEEYGNRLLIELTEDVIYDRVQRWKAEHKHNTVVTYVNYLSFFFNYLQAEGFVKANPVRRLKYKQKRVRVIPEEHFNTYCDYIKPKNIEAYNFLQFLWLTGRRVGEACRLHWEDILWDEKLIYIRNQKGKREDEYPLYGKLEDFLKSLGVQKSGKVFVYSDKNPLKFWRKYQIDYNKEQKEDKDKLPYYTLHEIRKTFQTNLVRRAVPVIDGSKILGHKDIRTTQKSYSLIENERLVNVLNSL